MQVNLNVSFLLCLMGSLIRYLDSIMVRFLHSCIYSFQMLTYAMYRKRTGGKDQTRSSQDSNAVDSRVWPTITWSWGKLIMYKSLRHLLTCFLMYRPLTEHNDHSTMTSQDTITGSIDCSHIDSPINFLPPFNYHNYHPLLTILPIIMLVTMYVSNESSTMPPICSFDSIRWLAVDWRKQSQSFIAVWHSYPLTR